jgi:signal transduction histidine kinase
VVEQALSLVQHELVRARVTVVTELGKDIPPLKLNRNKIEQVFVNLFMNAVQAMPEGGTLTIRTAAKRGSKLGPVVGGRKTGPRRSGETLVVAELEDTGTGIPEDKLDRVFDPFFTTKPVGQGTGLGLPVTRKIIELHGGTMDIRNRQAGGVRVTLTFTTGGGNDDAEATISQNQQAEDD